MKFFKKFVRDTKAATAIEYGLIAALIAVAAITALTNVGSSVSNTFDKVDGKLTNANSKA
ncbi:MULTISPECIES: Flp family type IVb pilin [Sphingopyxis]|jgi:pilus assembly protein Flp/PilA|uniref:Flp family type IVb pilin n=1 Tax=Sphingopyxis TaxID=165697 RepID=UPI000831C2CF|nr:MULTISPECIES: Flp family type IVb pilin [Sphingopyxis]APW73596.1 pilin [Sphingopyxis granuli]AVA14742.1 Flp family type IVb pilin [Sphingopyxis sp. MG]ODU27051.1 MAG: pilin [Sphingopyxis sp. SCN 67-31]